MARDTKISLDYFPLCCVLDDKFELIEAEFGLKGFAIVVKLLQRIYGTFGYYCEWNKDGELLFSRKCGEGCNVVVEVVNRCFDRGLFDRSLHEKYQILTSHGIQRQYLKSSDRRKEVPMIKEYLLLSTHEITENVNIYPLNADINRINADINPQIKVNKTKRKETKDIYTSTPVGSQDCKQSEDHALYQRVIDYLNEKCGTAYKASSKATQRLIHARAADGFGLDDFKYVIDIQAAEWKGTKMEGYLRPETLFGTKFESYRNKKQAFKQEEWNRSSQQCHGRRDNVGNFQQRQYESSQLSGMMISRHNLTGLGSAVTGGEENEDS